MPASPELKIKWGIEFDNLHMPFKLHDIDDVSVDELIDEAVHRAQVGAEAAGITLDTDPPTGLMVRGDHTLLLTARHLHQLVVLAIRKTYRFEQFLGPFVRADL